jgi:UPF0716 protein FxsA
MIRKIFLGILLFAFCEFYFGLVIIREFGLANTLFAWLTTFILGVGLFRSSSVRLGFGVANAMREGKPPGLAALDGAIIGLAGVLFLIPGFLTDVVAILLLIPPLRHWGSKKLLSAVIIRQHGAAAGSPRGATHGQPSFDDASTAVIDVEAVDITDAEPTSKQDSQFPRGK